MKKSLVALAFGTLGLGIAEFVMMGILPDVAHDLGVSIPVAGYLISAYALGVCVGAPLMVFIARNRPLKQILLFLMVLFTIGNLCASLAPNYWILLLMRFVSGLPHGAYFGVGSIVAERLADRGKSSQAIAVMVSGMTIANLGGVPLGTFLSTFLSWRLIFMLSTVWGVITLVQIYRWVPEQAPLPNTGLRGQFRFLKNPASWLLICAIMFGNGGVFCWYSYVTPLMTQVAGYAPEIMTFLMILAGGSMCLGNILGGRLADRYAPGRVAGITQAIICIALLLTFYLAGNPVMAVILMCVCTAGLFALSSPQQLLLLRYSRGGEMMGAACAQIAFNIGNAIGAYCGGIPLQAGLGYRYPALIGAFITFIGSFCLWYFSHKYEFRKNL